MTGILGRKIGMTVKFGTDGEMIPVTVIQAGPCKVIGKRNQQAHGYEACMVGFEEVPGNRLRKKLLLGFFKKLGTPAYRVVREFRGLEADVGTDLSVENFKPGDLLKVTGYSRGKGWAGAIKRWNFSRGRETHGGNFNRAIGGTGMKEYPGRVLKGKKMSGRMGNDKKTYKSIEVVETIPEDNLLIVKGPIAGGENGLLKIVKYSQKAAAA